MDLENFKAPKEVKAIIKSEEKTEAKKKTTETKEEKTEE